MNSDNYVDGLELRIKELAAENERLIGLDAIAKEYGIDGFVEIEKLRALCRLQHDALDYEVNVLGFDSAIAKEAINAYKEFNK